MTDEPADCVAADAGDVVVVTGASGFIAAHIVQQAQQAGYHVRGTVRSLDTDKVDFLYHLCPDAADPVELVKADLIDPDCWNEVVKGAKYVLHVASPFPKKNVKEKDLTDAAVGGTLNLLKACVAAKTVKRVVVTGSIVSMASGDTVGDISEKDWVDPNTVPGYDKSKILAEKATWDFVESLSDDDKFELVVVHPGFTFGPVLNKTLGTSADIMKQLLTRAVPLVPYMQVHLSDVRDVAACHIKALTAPGAVGNRHILVNHTLWMEDMTQILHQEFSPQGYSIPTKRLPYALLWLMSWVKSQLVDVTKRHGVKQTYDNSRMREVLGVEPRDVKDTVIDSAYSLIEQGFVPKKKGYKGPGNKTPA